MEENETNSTLDLEFKRYLQILRPYLGQLIDDDIIAICNAWIQRLSECNEKEKAMRNKYVFSLCYQLAKGTLEDPFLKKPPASTLPSISESMSSEESSTEVECYVVNAEDTRTEVLFHDTDYHSQKNEYSHTQSVSQEFDTDLKSSQSNSKQTSKQTFMCYNCPEILNKYIYSNDSNGAYEHRANNLIKKLRDIKTQNILLQNELTALKRESANKHNIFIDGDSKKVDRATSVFLHSTDSNTTLKSLKFKLQEVQESRNNLIDKIAYLQDVVNNFDDLKKHEIDEIIAKHKIEIINIKTVTKDEVKGDYEKKIETIKQEYEFKIETIKKKLCDEIQILSSSKNDAIDEKTKTILAKNNEIIKLNTQIDDLKSHLHTVLEKFIDKPTYNYNGEDNMRFKAEQLEKRLSKMEKNKVKSTRIFETKVAKLQREKHLTECSLQLQMVRQRAQVVKEVTDENQAELTTALDKLETKYKEIVANVQSTAIQRRMQDQMALESILQAACCIPNENNNPPGTNGQFPKTMRNSNQSCDGGISPISHGNKVGNICMGNKSFTDDSVMTGFCLNGEKMGELFGRVYIPQRDNSDAMKK